MRLLLDTHVAVWAVTGDNRLSRRARQLLEDPETEGFVSVVTIWEIAIKHALRGATRDPMLLSGAQALRDFEDAEFEILDVEPHHVTAIDGMARLHGDPFDRLLLAVAITDGLTLLTQDAKLGDYGRSVIVT